MLRLPDRFSGDSQGANRRSPTRARAVAQASRHGGSSRRIGERINALVGKQKRAFIREAVEKEVARLQKGRTG